MGSFVERTTSVQGEEAKTEARERVYRGKKHGLVFFGLAGVVGRFR